jgi:hypothetical protein
MSGPFGLTLQQQQNAAAAEANKAAAAAAAAPAAAAAAPLPSSLNKSNLANPLPGTGSVVATNSLGCNKCEAEILSQVLEIKAFVDPSLKNIKAAVKAQADAAIQQAAAGQTTVLMVLKKAEGALKAAVQAKGVSSIVKQGLLGAKLAADGTVGVTQGLFKSAVNNATGVKVNSLIQAAISFQENLENLAKLIKVDPKSKNPETIASWTSTLLTIATLITEFSVEPYDKMPWPASQKMPRFSWFTVMDKNGKTRAQKAASALGVRLASFGSYLVGKNGFRSNVTKKFGSTFSGLSGLLNVASGARDRRRLEQIWQATTPQGQAAMQEAATAASKAATAAGATAAAASAAAVSAAAAVGQASGAAASSATSLLSRTALVNKNAAAAQAAARNRAAELGLSWGGRRSRKNRSRKNRKASRKNRKASRKNRH